jgi:dethiobiotin synthetase
VKGYFITGTDTSVGKTFVAVALAKRARALGHRVFAFKPIETGCVPDPDGTLLGDDQDLLATAAGNWQRGTLRGIYRFPLPAAPRVAAEAVSTAIDLQLILETARRGADQSNVSLTLAEGAGGWRVPITDSADMATLARDLGLPVVVVARAGLGTINHSLLTVEAVERDGLAVAALVLSRRPDESLGVAQSNRTEILRRWPGQVLIFESDPSVLDPLLECST